MPVAVAVARTRLVAARSAGPAESDELAQLGDLLLLAGDDVALVLDREGQVQDLLDDGGRHRYQAPPSSGETGVAPPPLLVGTAAAAFASTSGAEEMEIGGAWFGGASGAAEGADSTAFSACGSSMTARVSKLVGSPRP